MLQEYGRDFKKPGILQSPILTTSGTRYPLNCREFPTTFRNLFDGHTQLSPAPFLQTKAYA